MCINIIRNLNKVYKSLKFTIYNLKNNTQIFKNIYQVNKTKQVNQLKQVKDNNNRYLENFEKIENKLKSYNKINKV